MHCTSSSSPYRVTSPGSGRSPSHSSSHSSKNWRTPSGPRKVVPVRWGSRTTMSGSQSSSTASISPRLNASNAACTISRSEPPIGPAVSRSLALPAQRRALDRLREQHLLGEDQVLTVVVGHLVLVAHRDRVEGTGHLAVAAEDAAREVDLVDLGVALAGGHAVIGIILSRDDPDAVRRARRGAQRTTDALLEAGVLELVELVAAAEPRVDRRLLLRVLDRDRPLDDARERGLQPAEGLAERAVCASDATGLGPALDVDDALVGQVGKALVRAVIAHVTVTRIAVTRTFSVASGSRIFQPRDMSWS